MKPINALALSASDHAGAQSGVQLDSNQWFSASFHAYFGDSSAAGTLKLQASNDTFDILGAAGAVVNWVDIPNLTATIASGATAILTLSVSCYRWLRVVYTPSGGGSTTITVNVFAASY